MHLFIRRRECHLWTPPFTQLGAGHVGLHSPGKDEMRALIAALFLATAAPAGADCSGQNMFEAMPAADRAAIHARADAEPFSRGNFWTATKDGRRVTLVGTYHLADPRHDPVVAALAPRIRSAATVLVEAGPDEEKALINHMAKNPSLMILTETSLPELLPPDDWSQLSQALRLRGIPGFVAAKFQPWYVSMLLATPSCKMKGEALHDGLDARIMDEAKTSGVPIRALEPFDTVFRIFDQMPLAEQIDMIRYSLGMEDRVEDFSTTLADSYFAGESRVIWELTRHEALRLSADDPAQVEQDFILMEEIMMAARNRGWVTVIEEAAGHGPTVAAFGALHLAGREGVANLLAQRGWTVAPLALP